MIITITQLGNSILILNNSSEEEDEEDKEAVRIEFTEQIAYPENDENAINLRWLDIIVWSELPRILHFFLKLYFAFFSAPSSFWILGRAYSYRENYALSRSKKN